MTDTTRSTDTNSTQIDRDSIATALEQEETEVVTNLVDTLCDRIEALESRVSELEQRTDDTDAVREENRRLRERVAELETRLDKQATLTWDSDDLQDVTLESTNGVKVPLGRIINAKVSEQDLDEHLTDSTLTDAVAELQSRELEKGAHLQFETVTEHVELLDVDGDRLERFEGEDGDTWVRLPNAEDPLERSGTSALATADLLPIQQLARMDEEMLANATSRRADYLAAKAWAERGKNSKSSLWSAGCRSVSEYIDASDLRVWIKANHQRPDEDMTYENAKKLAGKALERIQQLAKNRVYIEKRDRRKDGLKYKERRLVVPTDAEIPGEGTSHDDAPGTTELTG
ncbi:hypothetical protein ACFR9U_16120 [Halorientalis brevis]|uniref:Transposase n=1 Tax=Halorientalis brevis TaxID=1126241 RepID=A0ABD6CFX9_9EURY|nr:hypothetical protein [Halorientalis brevis]